MYCSIVYAIVVLSYMFLLCYLMLVLFVFFQWLYVYLLGELCLEKFNGVVLFENIMVNVLNVW